MEDGDLARKFEAVFHQHHLALCKFAYNLMGDLDASKDIVQEVFVKLWGRRDKVEMGAPIANYLRQATTHACFNALKQNKNRLRILGDVAWISRRPPAENSQSLVYDELEAEARRAIDRLPPKCRVIFLLSRQEEMKYQEIADHLNLSVKTVEQQMGIALQRLRNHLKPFLTREFIVPVIFLLALFFILKIFQS